MRPVTGRAPLVTVALPVFNGENYLARSLESLIAQDYPNMQLLLADNGSTDATESICREAAERDNRVTYLRSPENRGAAWNYNRAFDAAQGEYFKWTAHDDRCAPTYVSRCVTALEEFGPEAVLAYPKTLVIDKDDQVVGEFEDGMDLREPTPHERLAHFLATRTEYHAVFGVMRMEVLRETRLIDRFVGSDVVLLAEMALRGRFLEVPERLFHRRFHEDNSVNANPDYQDRAAWFDPALRKRKSLPFTQMTIQIAASVRKAELGLAEQGRCLDALARHWARPYWRHMAGEIRATVTKKPRSGLSAS
ncbi:glycosyl transferase [Pseudofrankia sp. BMG5.36]|nr:glycosyl transferase [Pseudofrankia sp. BMG5.36]